MCHTVSGFYRPIIVSGSRWAPPTGLPAQSPSAQLEPRSMTDHQGDPNTCGHYREALKGHSADPGFPRAFSRPHQEKEMVAAASSHVLITKPDRCLGRTELPMGSACLSFLPSFLVLQGFFPPSLVVSTFPPSFFIAHITETY